MYRALALALLMLPIAADAADSVKPPYWASIGAERARTRQGYTVIAADNGEAALEVLDRIDRPDLLISDVVMPTMDGPTMVRHARERYPDLPVLFMSGYAEETLRKSIDLDNVQFLAKPFSVQQLAEAARTVLASK